MQAPILAASAFLSVALPAAARAESCAKSRDYILSSGALMHKPQIYKDLFKMCTETLQLPNVKDAFILQAGAIAVVPRADGIAPTATTLAQFCTRFPRGTLHFVTKDEARRAVGVAQAVRIPLGTSTPCQKIKGR